LCRYTAGVLALNPDTGKLKWYFQFTPHDVYDYDANETPVLVDLQEQGKTRHLLVQANRYGFFYILDRTNGKFLHAAPFVYKLNWGESGGPKRSSNSDGPHPHWEGHFYLPWHKRRHELVFPFV